MRAEERNEPPVEAVIFTGIQGAGKSTFYKDRFFHTHVRINLDMLRTRNREQPLVELCLRMGQRFVVDNTNPTAEARARYIGPAKARGFQVLSYYFPPELAGSMERNALRTGTARVPAMAILGTRKRMQPPAMVEGFDALYEVRIDENGLFIVEERTGEASIPKP